MYAMFAIVSSSLLKENLPSHIVTQMAYMVNKVLARAKKKKGNEDCKDVWKSVRRVKNPSARPSSLVTGASIPAGMVHMHAEI
jgi:hypothetical protein